MKAGSKLFVSCDLVGSTAFKQQRDTDWSPALLLFYRQFPQEVQGAKLALGPNLEFKLWKPVGDELIFEIEVSHERDVYDAINVWLSAMQRYEANVHGSAPGLRTKGSAFIATFPGPDQVATIPKRTELERSDHEVRALNAELIERYDAGDPDPDYLYDYFGPSIDTGFRTASACDARFFTLSVEVAWCLAVASAKTKMRRLVYLDSRPFKGVWNGREYPIFAIDRHSDDLVNQALRSALQPELTTRQIQKICRACVASPDWPSAIFLPQSGKRYFRTMPSAVARHLEDAAASSLSGREELPGDGIGAPLPKSLPMGDEITLPRPR